MATFEVMKRTLETMEKNVKVSKKLLEDRVNSLDEMKRNRQEAETEGDKREPSKPSRTSLTRTELQ